MSLFSLFSKKEKEQTSLEEYPKKSTLQLASFLDREFFKYNVDKSKNMILCFLNGEGWIWANRRFLDTMGYNDIYDFTREHSSIRDLFLSESEEIFTETEKNWLDYIIKYKQQGHHVNIATKEHTLMMIKAYCSVYPRNEELYILEFEDVTKLHEAQLKTDELEALKSRFLANIGHEFRTPMNGILGFLELLKQTDMDKKQLEYLEMINQSSKSLMTNIEALLTLSQLQSGGMELDVERFNILPLMEEVAYSFYKQGRAKGIKVLTFIDPKLPQIVKGDPDKIVQVMHAILNNAIKFVPRGGRVIIEVKLVRHAQNGDCSISFGVKDNGKGMPQEQIALINKPFTTGNPSDERLGVGLSLSHGLVALMDSELKVQSELNKGTFVNFVLDFKNAQGQNFKMAPKKNVKVLLLDQSKVDEANFLAIYLRSFALDVVKSNTLDADVYEGVEALYVVANQDDSSWMLEIGTYKKKIPLIILLDEDEKLRTRLTHIVDGIIRRPLLPTAVSKHLHNETIQKHTQHTLETKDLKILVAEDNLINQRLIQILLQQYNVVVATASNGLEAVDMCRKNRYDIIFMDIDMPQMNGIMATKEIKSYAKGRFKTPPIVALTAMAMEGDKEMLLQEGLDDYLSKPFTREKLEYILNKYLAIKA